MSELIAPFINLLILIGILFYYLREPVKTSVRQRHESLRDELGRVRDLLANAKNQYEEFTAKLQAIGAETTALRQQASQDAQASKQRILSDAQKLAVTIGADARRAAEVLYADLKGELYTELGHRVLDRAETLLKERLTGDDRDRIRREFSTQVAEFAHPAEEFSTKAETIQ